MSHRSFPPVIIIALCLIVWIWVLPADAQSRGPGSLGPTIPSGDFSPRAARSSGFDAYTIAGTVRDYNGTPLSFITIAYFGPENGAAISGADGAYLISVSTAGTYNLRVVHPDYPAPPDQSVIVPPSRTNVDFTFPQRYTIAGSVYGSGGTPMAGVSVFYSGPVNGAEQTDTSGTYLLTISAGTYSVRVIAPGYPSLPAQVVTVPPSRTGVDFQFSAAGTASPTPTPTATATVTPTPTSTPEVAEKYVLTATWDGSPPAGSFNDPQGIAVDRHGNVYVADTGNYRIQKFTVNGDLLAMWGEPWIPAAAESQPLSIAVDAQGNVYATYDIGWWDDRAIQKFTSDGGFISAWGDLDRAVAVDGAAHVYTALENGEVYKYDTNGQVLASWSVPDGSWPPMQLAIDPAGFLYVAKKGDDMLRKYDLDGHLLATWDLNYASCMGLAVEANGDLLVLESGDVSRYNSAGQYLMSFGGYGTGDGKLQDATDLAVAPDGTVYVIDAGNQRVQHYSAAGADLGHWGVPSLGHHLLTPDGIAVGGDSRVCLAEPSPDRLQCFTAAGEFLAGWSTPIYPSGVAIDASGNVYVSNPGVPDSGSRTITGCPRGIRKYTPAGEELGAWAPCGSDPGQANWPSGVAVEPAGAMYLADTQNDRVQKLNADGSFNQAWPVSTADDRFTLAEGIALAPDGSVYVVDTWNNSVKQYSAAGDLVRRWGGYGTEDGRFSGPKGIAVDRQGFIYIADAHNNRVQKFTAQGAFVTTWGSKGHDAGQFSGPLGVAVDAAGRVYVSDTYNNRVQVFELAVPNLTSSTKRVSVPTAHSGDRLTYTITLRNTGRLPATAAAMTDPLPAWTTYVPGSLSASSGSATAEDDVIRWNGSVGVGAQVTLSFDVTITTAAPAGIALTNRATLDDGVNPAFERSVTVIANPYSNYLPLVRGK